jgi:hypothetical protein
LYILTGGQVKITGGEFIRHFSNAFPLLERHFTIGQLDTDHLHAGLALSVDTPGQAQAAELFVGDLSLTEQQDLFFQFYDISFYNGIFQFCSEALHAKFIYGGKFVKIKSPLNAEAMYMLLNFNTLVVRYIQLRLINILYSYSFSGLYKDRERKQDFKTFLG